MTPLSRAADWLDARCRDRNWPVYVERDGKVQCVAWVYKIKREGRASVWYLRTYGPEWVTVSIKRICRG